MISRKFKGENNKNKNISRQIHMKNKNIFIKITVLLIILITICYFLFIRPTILTVLDYQGKLYCTKILTQSVFELLEDKNIEYDDFIQINKDESGKIISLKTNGKNVNTFKNNMMKSLWEAMSTSKRYQYKIPIGTLLGSEIFLGRGPYVTMKIVPTGYPTVNLISRFEEAGINQTKHSIIMTVSLLYTSIIPFNKIAEEIKSEFIVSETLIIGEVPQFYSNSK